MTPSEFKYIRRDDLGMTQKQLADHLGVSEAKISLLERSYEKVSTLYELAILHLVWKQKVRPLILDLL